MGSPGPAGGFDIQNFFNATPPSSLSSYSAPSAPYPPANHGYQQQAAPSHPYTLNHFPPNSYTSGNNFPSLPGTYPYNSQQTQPGMQNPGMYHPYMHYGQDHGSRPAPGPFPNVPYPPFAPVGPQGAQHGTFSQPQYSATSSSNAPNFTPSPAPPVPQTSGTKAPAQSTLPASTSPVLAPDQVANPPLDGAHLMALLTTQSAAETANNEESSSLLLGNPSLIDLPPGPNSSGAAQGSGSDLSLPPPAISPALPTAPPVNLATSRLPGSKPSPRGRFLKGDHVVYDVDVRLPFEVQPQLEVSPITVYTSDPVLVLGRQIAVNRTYICYGLRPGTIRILNINTALRALLRGHTQRVTDMVFFNEEVHLLASASTDCRVFVRKIIEGNSDDGRTAITDKILVAVQFQGEWASVHPRVCWHSQNKDLLVVGIGKYVLTVDIGKFRVNAPPDGFTAEAPIVCHMNSPLEGVNFVGEHTSDVTDLSVPRWIPNCFASSSQDGTVRIWGDKKAPLAAFVPHQGQPVNSVAFISAPRRPDQAVLFTAGPLNRELKLWAPAIAEGPPIKPGSGNWHCIQTLELKSSAEAKLEKAFFNQVLVVPKACLIILANTKKKAIYVVHLEFGSTIAATRMDYLAEFSVTMPILSLTATSEGVSDGEGTVQVYCVQTQAIQQYALELSQCLPDPAEAALEKGMVESQGTGKLTSQVYTQVDSSFSTTVSELSSSSTTTATVVASGPNKNSPGPILGSTYGMPSDRSVSYDHTMSSEVSLAEETTASVTHQTVQVDGPGSIESFSALGRFNDASSTPHSVRPVIPAQVPSFLKRQPHVDGPSKVSEDGYPLPKTNAGVSVEHSEGTQLPEQPTLDTVLPDVGGLKSITSASLVGDNAFEKEEEELPGLTSSNSKPPALQQQSSGGTVHLLSPSELMNMVARSKASSESDSSGHASQSPKSTDVGKVEVAPEDASGDVDLDILRPDLIVVADSDVDQPEILGPKDAVFDDKASVSVDVKDKVLGTTSLEYSSKKEFSWEGSSSGTNFIEASRTDEMHQVEDAETLDERDLMSNSPPEEVQELVKDAIPKTGEISVATAPSQSPANTKGRKNKNKTNVGGVSIAAVPSIPLPSPAQLPFPTLNPATSEGESSTSANVVAGEMSLGYKIASIQESVSQLVAFQKDLHKQMTVMIAVPVAKESKRVESALGQRMEKLLKAHLDAMWARIQEENAKREKVEQARVQQLTTLLSNSFTKDLPAALERVFKKEVSSIGPVIARLVSPNVEKTIMTAIPDVFQKGLAEKVIPQLEKAVATKLDAAVTRQLQTQLPIALKPALQEALRTAFETTVIPGFERSCQVMFEQVNATFQRGLAEHTTNAQQHFETSHSALAATLKDTMLSATSLASSLKGELTEGQRKLVALAENAGANAARASMTAVKQTNGGLPDKVLSLQHLEESLDPTIELSRLVSERKLEEAFNKALSLSDVAIVSWLCTQVDVKALMATQPLPLSQGVLLSLVQQLGCDLGKGTAQKLEWIREGALVLNPKDPVLAPHMRPFLEQLYKNLHHHTHLTAAGGELANSMRLVLHVVNSLLTACK